jgi:hypothetical protein
MHRMKALALAALLLAGCTVATSPAEQGAPVTQADTVPENAAFGQACRSHGDGPGTTDDEQACTGGLVCFGETLLHVGERVCTFECDAPRCAAAGGKCVHAWDTCATDGAPFPCEPTRLTAHALCVVP